MTISKSFIAYKLIVNHITRTSSIERGHRLVVNVCRLIKVLFLVLPTFIDKEWLLEENLDHGDNS
jgi:hypothetical protein